MPKSQDTRQQMLAAATKAFSEKGFYGTSIAAITQDLPYTKQALLHHFGSKEKLYGEVLAGISNTMIENINAVRMDFDKPQLALQEFFIRFYRYTQTQRVETYLLMRELMDNKQRADASQVWYLKPFVELLADMFIQAIDTQTDEANALAAIYQLLGAVNYFAISEATLTNMLGEEQFSRMRNHFESELRQLVRARLDCATASPFAGKQT